VTAERVGFQKQTIYVVCLRLGERSVDLQNICRQWRISILRDGVVRKFLIWWGVHLSLRFGDVNHASFCRIFWFFETFNRFVSSSQRSCLAATAQPSQPQTHQNNLHPEFFIKFQWQNQWKFGYFVYFLIVAEFSPPVHLLEARQCLPGIRQEHQRHQEVAQMDPTAFLKR
jgi:hypothetical protein